MSSPEHAARPTIATLAPADDSLKIADVYESSLKFLLVASLELYLSLMLVAAFFECPDDTCTDDERDEQELQTLYTLSWPPVACALLLVFSHRLCGRWGFLPEHFDRNLIRMKLLMWVIAFVDLVVDKDMEIKRGPGLVVAVLFCAVDLARFYMEMHCLVEDEEEQEEEVDRLANMVLSALEANQRESAFKHAVHAVMEQNRETDRMQFSPAYNDERLSDMESLSPLGYGDRSPVASPYRGEYDDYGATSDSRRDQPPSARSHYSL